MIRRSFIAVTLLSAILSTAPVNALERRSIVGAQENEHVLLVQETMAKPASQLYGVLNDWSRRARVQRPPTFDHWQLAPDSTVGIGAWTEYDLRLGDSIRHERMVIADDVPDRYVRERSDMAQSPYEVHWLLEPIGDGKTTSVTVAIHIPDNRNWFASIWQQFTTEPALRQAYADVVHQLATAADDKP